MRTRKLHTQYRRALVLNLRKNISNKCDAVIFSISLMVSFLLLLFSIGPSTILELLLRKKRDEEKIDLFVCLLPVRLSLRLVFIFQFLSFSQWRGNQLQPPETSQIHFTLLLCCVTSTPFFFYSLSLSLCERVYVCDDSLHFSFWKLILIIT